MFTDAELKELHFEMWDYIVKRLSEYEDNQTYNICPSIIELKTLFLVDMGIRYNIYNKCFLCEYSIRHSGDGNSICSKCPSILNSGFGSCLSGLYEATNYTEDVHTKIVLAKLIRDSWKDDIS